MATATVSDSSKAPLIRRILHPSDLSEASLVAFVHALKAALVARAKLVLLHVTEEASGEWGEFPGVRETLERWQLLPPGSSRNAVVDLGIDVAKIVGRGPDPTEGVLTYLKKEGADLIVLATHHRGLDWLQRSISEPVARQSDEMTLFVPANGRHFISSEDGSISLRNVLIPLAETPRPEAAISGAARLVQQLECESGTFTLLHVGEDPLTVATPNVPGWRWQKLTRSGNVIDLILETAHNTHADLIVMATDGRQGFLDALRGSHTERVLRQSPCPLLAIPELSYVGDQMAEELSTASDSTLR